MNQRDIIGNWGGCGWPGMIAFGADGSAASADPNAMLVANGFNFNTNPFACGSPAPMVDPNALATLIASKNSALVGMDCPSHAVDQILPFESVDIAGNDTVVVQAVPQILFAANRLLIPSSIATQIAINSCTIGTRNQFAGSGPVHGLTFAENATYVKVAFDTLSVNMPAFLSVTNLTANTVTFYGTFIGKAVYPGGPRILGA